jgi:hypothetical protein
MKVEVVQGLFETTGPGMHFSQGKVDRARVVTLQPHAWKRQETKKLRNQQETRNTICQPRDFDHDHGTVVAGTVAVAVCSAAACDRDKRLALGPPNCR